MFRTVAERRRSIRYVHSACIFFRKACYRQLDSTDVKNTVVDLNSMTKRFCVSEDFSKSHSNYMNESLYVFSEDPFAGCVLNKNPRYEFHTFATIQFDASVFVQPRPESKPRLFSSSRVSSLHRIALV